MQNAADIRTEVDLLLVGVGLPGFSNTYRAFVSLQVHVTRAVDDSLPRMAYDSAKRELISQTVHFAKSEWNCEQQLQPQLIQEDVISNSHPTFQGALARSCSNSPKFGANGATSLGLTLAVCELTGGPLGMLPQIEKARAAMAGAEALARAGRAAEVALRDNIVIVVRLEASVVGLAS